MTTMTEDRRPPRTAIRRPGAGIDIEPRKLIWWRDRRAMSRQDLSEAITKLTITGHRDALTFTHRRAQIPGIRIKVYDVLYWDPETGRDRIRPFTTEAGARRFKAKQDALLPVHKVVPTPDGDTCTKCGAPAAGGLTRDAIAKIENRERRPKPRTLRAICAALTVGRGKVRPEDLMPGGPVPELSEELQARQARIEYNRAMRAFADALGREDLYRNASGRIFYTVELMELYDQYLADTGAESAGAPAALSA